MSYGIFLDGSFATDPKKLLSPLKNGCFLASDAITKVVTAENISLYLQGIWFGERVVFQKKFRTLHLNKF
jgi:hypothetical protein